MGSTAVTDIKMCVLIFSTTSVWNISHSTKNWARYDTKCTYIGLTVKYRLFLSDFNENWNFLDTFSRNDSHIKFHENPFNGSRVLCRRTDVTKLTVAFHDFANEPKIGLLGSACSMCVGGATKRSSSAPNRLPRLFLWRFSASFLCQLQFCNWLARCFPSCRFVQ